MKELFLGLGLILVIGVAGFAYRVIIERPPVTLSVCGEEVKVCPSGASVGREGASCAFAGCPLPNLAIPDINATILLPEGYSFLPKGSAESLSFAGSLISTTTDPTARSIGFYQYRIPEDGKDAEAIMLEHTTLSPSGEKVKSVNVFKKISIAGRDYYSIVGERFEGVVAITYYLPQDKRVIRFDVVEHDVQNWTDSKLVVAELPGQKIFLKILETIQL